MIIFCLGFGDRIWILNAVVPGHCLLVTLRKKRDYTIIRLVDLYDEAKFNK